MKYTKKSKYITVGLLVVSIVCSYLLFISREPQKLTVTESPVNNIDEIVLVPISGRQEEIIETLQFNLKQTFPNTKITVDQSIVTLPKEIFNPKRQQYDAADILEEIDRLFSDQRSTQMVIAVIDDNIYSENLNFVFSSIDIENNIGVVSTYYLQKEVPISSDTVNRLEFALEVTDKRVYKTTLRMVGGMVGLESGISRGSECVMNFSSTLIELDKKGLAWCDDETSILKTAGLF